MDFLWPCWILYTNVFLILLIFCFLSYINVPTTDGYSRITTVFNAIYFRLIFFQVAFFLFFVLIVKIYFTTLLLSPSHFPFKIINHVHLWSIFLGTENYVILKTWLTKNSKDHLKNYLVLQKRNVLLVSLKVRNFSASVYLCIHNNALFLCRLLIWTSNRSIWS